MRRALSGGGAHSQEGWTVMTNPFAEGSSGQGPRWPATPITPAGTGPGLSADMADTGARARDALDLDGRARDLRRAAEGMRTAQERIAVLVGTGTAANDRVRVTWATATGLDQLYLDPQVMRMPSQDLATAIKQAVAAAMADLRRKTAEVMREETGADPDREAAGAEDLRDAYNRQMGEITVRVEQASRAMRDALRP